nr:endoglucanase 6 [Quercus suber]
MTDPVSYRFGSASHRFQISQSGDFTAPASEQRVKSERRPRLIRSALQSGRYRRRRSVWSAPVADNQYYLNYLGKNGDSLDGTGWSMI